MLWLLLIDIENFKYEQLALGEMPIMREYTALIDFRKKNVCDVMRGYAEDSGVMQWPVARRLRGGKQSYTSRLCGVKQ